MSSEAGRELARKLRRLRAESGMTTRALAAMTGFSQSKVVRIERGKTAVTPGDVHRMLEALKVRAEIVDSLVTDAQEIHISRFGKQSPCKHPEGSPLIIEDLEHDTRVTREVRNSMFPTLFQSLAYVEKMYYLNQHYFGPLNMSLRDVAEIKLRRQAAMISGRKDSIALLDESVLLRPILPPRQWLQQLHLICDRARTPRLQFGIVPLGEVAVPIGSWRIYDDRVVHYEEVNKALTRFDRTEARIRQEELEAIANTAVYGSAVEKRVVAAIKQLETIDLRRNRSMRSTTPTT